MTPAWAQLGYLAAAVCFIVALKGLSSPKTARRGNLIGAAGAVLAARPWAALGEGRRGGPACLLAALLAALARLLRACRGLGLARGRCTAGRA